MAADALRRVTAGQPLALSADAWNAHNDAARWVRDRARNLGAKVGPTPPSSTIVIGCNSTGAALPDRAVVAYGSPVSDPADDEEGFLASTAFQASPPATALAANWGVTIEPAATDECVRVVVHGVVQARVRGDADVGNQVGPVAADTEALAVVSGGAARVLWIAPKDPDHPDDPRWAVIRIGDAGDPDPYIRGIVQADVSKDGQVEMTVACSGSGSSSSGSSNRTQTVWSPYGCVSAGKQVGAHWNRRCKRYEIAVEDCDSCGTSSSSGTGGGACVAYTLVAICSGGVVVWSGGGGCGAGCCETTSLRAPEFVGDVVEVECAALSFGEECFPLVGGGDGPACEGDPPPDEGCTGSAGWIAVCVVLGGGPGTGVLRYQLDTYTCAGTGCSAEEPASAPTSVGQTTTTACSTSGTVSTIGAYGGPVGGACVVGGGGPS